MIELAKEQEKVILVGVSLPGQEDTGQLLDELAFLADTAGAREVGRVIQSRDQIHPGTYVGTGKIMEIKDLLWETDASGIICDDELSPAQMKNLQDELEVKVLDRTLLILDIFAARARTPARGRSRWSWRSLSTGSPGLRDLEPPCPGLAEVLVREDPERRSWRWTGG